MTNIEKIIANQELDAKQLAFYYKYRTNPDFQAILAPFFYYELPHVLDRYILMEREVVDLGQTFKLVLRQQKQIQKEADAILTAFETDNHWSASLQVGTEKALTTPTDIATIYGLCQKLTRRELDAKSVLVYFFRYLLESKTLIQQHNLGGKRTLEQIFQDTPPDWYAEPWYYIYVQYFGTDEAGNGGFSQLQQMLDYLEAIGIKNIYILPHYESPNGDAGYDISDYQPAKAYGGMPAFKAFMKEALARGFRIATDLVFNHCSVEHEWFQRALKGESQYFNYFLKCPSSWAELDIDSILKDEAGDLYLYLPERDEEGREVTSKRILIFPDVDDTVWLTQKVDVLEKSVLFYREFYPFQVDMDIQEPEVVKELFAFLAEELSIGVLGKRTDAIAHWVKKPGTEAKNLPATYALQQLIKQFLKHVNSKTIILPEVVTTSKMLKGYAGEATYINGKLTTTGGDALLDFQLQGMLREMMYFQKTTPFWTQVFDLGASKNKTAVSLIPIEHHDETYMGFIQELEPMRAYLASNYTYFDDQNRYQRSQRGIIYKNGMSAGACYADALNRDARRIANAFFCLYMFPGVPVIYYGSEIGASNRWEQMKKRQVEQFETMLRLLGPSLVGPGKAITFEKCEDPRELQRGPLTKTAYYKALEDSYPAVELIKALNELRSQHSALRSDRIEPVDTYHESILGIIRYPQGAERSGNRPFLAFSNLSERPLLAKIPFTQIQSKLSTHQVVLKEKLYLFGKHPRAAEVTTWERRFNPGMPEFLEIALAPYSALLFEVRAIR